MVIRAIQGVMADAQQAATGGGGGTVSGHSTLPTNLVRYYSLDTADLSSGNPVDLTGTSNATTVGSPTTGTTGLISAGECFTFNGTDSAIQTDYDLGTVWSISLWAYLPTSVGSGQAMIGVRESNGNNREFQFGHYVNPGRIIWQWYTSSNGNAGAIDVTTTDDATHHFVLTRNGNNVELYIDGSSVGTNGTANKNETTQTLFIAKLGAASQQYYPERIDEIGIWTRVLTTDEVTDLYNSGSGLPYD